LTGFGLGVTRWGAAAPILGGNLFSKRAVEFATEFLFVAATVAANDRLKKHKLRRMAFRIAGFSCGYFACNRRVQRAVGVDALQRWASRV